MLKIQARNRNICRHGWCLSRFGAWKTDWQSTGVKLKILILQLQKIRDKDDFWLNIRYKKRPELVKFDKGIKGQI